MAEFKVDLDAEAVWLDDRWFKKDDLVGAIKAKLEAHDFQVTGLSRALETLDREVRSARVLAFRAPPEVADALAAHSAASGVPMGALLRHAVAQLLLMAQTEASNAAAAAQAQASAPVVAPEAAPVPTTNPAEVVHVNEPPTPEEHASAVPLRPKTTPASEADVEKAWFRDAK